MARKLKPKGTRKPRKADEIERKIERGEYAHGVTLRDLYGRLTAADVLAVPKFKRENRALTGMLAVLLTDAETRPGVIGKALAADALLDVPLVRLYDGLHEVDPAAPDAGDALRGFIEETVGALRQDFADVGDTMCEIVGKKRIPPEWKEIDEHARSELYELVRRIKAMRTGKRGALETFMDKATWTFRGFTVREIFKGTFTLNQFYNAERMKETRKEKRGDA